MELKNGNLVAYPIKNANEIVGGALVIMIFLAAAGIVLKCIVLDN